MECMSFSRLFMAVSLILIYVIQKLVGLAHQASPVNLKPLHEDMDVRHLAFEDQLQFIDSDDLKTDKLLDDIQLDSVSVSYLSISVLLFELNERQGCLKAANYSVIRTFSAVNVGQVVLKIRGFKIGSSSSASNILRGRLYNIAKTKAQHHQSQHRHQHQHQQSVCHGYGFTIYDCEPFDLEPNREHKIRIAFNPDFTLTKTIVSLTILTNLDEEFKFALVASIPRNLLSNCNQSLPRPDWEPTMHLILAFGMIIMILVSILTAYMEAMLYLKSQQSTSVQLSSGQATSHHNGGSNKDYERANCSNHSSDICNKDGSSGHGAAAISASTISSSHQQSQPYNALSANGNGKNNNNNSSNNNHNNNNILINKNNNNTSKANNCTQKRRKNSSTANSERVPTSNKSSLGSTNSGDKKSSSPYAPIFQNLTNVIASPPPPLPTFDSEFDSLEFKKLRSKKSAKKSNSLSGSIASSDDIGTPSSLNQSQGSSNQVNKTKANVKSNGLKLSSSNSINGESRDGDIQASLNHSPRTGSHGSKVGLKDAFTSTSLNNDQTTSDNIKLYNGTKVMRGKEEQSNLPPIQPPSSTASSSSSSASSKSSSSSSTSSTSSSPPLSVSSYGEYSLLGPGATFELPCLRVRSAQI